MNSCFPYKVLKEISLPGIENHFVMEDINGNKHLMPSDPYKDYPIKIGDIINCYIDKINCIGKVFIEPEHPYYKRENIYEMKIIDIGEKFYKRGKYRFTIKIIDYKGAIAEALPYNFDVNINFRYGLNTCRVIKLKKGKLVISNQL